MIAMSLKRWLLTGIDGVGIPRLRMPPTPCAMSVVLIPYIGHIDAFMGYFWLGVIAEPFLLHNIRSGMIDK